MKKSSDSATINDTRHKILIVDDDRRNIIIMEHILKSDYELATATSGEEALEKTPVFKPDIILLDIVMPGMDGYDVCRTIRKNEKLKYIKVMLVSGRSTLDERLIGYKAGADDYVTKPFEPDELLAKIKVFLRLKHYEEVNSIKDSFLTLMTHESRTPLSQIMGFGELLTTTDLSDDQQNWVQSILEAANILLTNSNKMLLLCKLKQGFNMKKESCSLQDLLDSIISELKDPQELKDITIAVSNNVAREIFVDHTLVKYALSFVFDNAVKFSPSGGKISITSDLQDGSCVIKISDQGKGIKSGQSEDIFNEFAIDDVTHHQEGLGISLVIARKIMELHRGSLTAQNNDDVGASFVFRLPC